MPKVVISVDPGSSESAIVIWNGTSIGTALILPNEDLIRLLLKSTKLMENHLFSIERIGSYGMIVGQEVFDTCVFIGRLQQVALQAGADVRLVFRRDVKLHLCGQARAKDANVTQALKDRFGEKGTKKEQGVTYKLSSHLWQAFALAVYTFDSEHAKKVCSE